MCVLTVCVCFFGFTITFDHSTTRICGNDCVTKGVPVKKGTRVFVPVCDIQRDPELWVDPDQFNPERWVTGPLIYTTLTDNVDLVIGCYRHGYCLC